ncbi:hypothetical protein G7059_03900 [Erysipelothrix sp. HDW6A]|nr:hypothetical protein G7059_03900 [Erysipelothrix sp. HDW6A]
MIFINKLFGINSMRKTCDEIQVNVAYRWFLGLGFEDTIPNHSTYSQNYRRKYRDNNIAEKIFMGVLTQLYDHELIDMESLFIDGTHIKANANKNKYTKEEALDHIRLTDKWKEIYPLRKETIERCFADGKAKHGMGFTRYKGKNKVRDDVYLLYAAMNIKKMVNYLSRIGKRPINNAFNRIKLVFMPIFFFFERSIKKESQQTLSLSTL